MRFTKILLLALSLMLFSCSQEEDVTVEYPSEIKLKNGGLTQEEVKKLTADCLVLSTSTEFINMRTQSKAFADMMNNHIDSTWTTRSDVENWLGKNLSQTKFASEQQGLDMFDNLAYLSKTFYVTNKTFFGALPGATGGQLQIILDPIAPDLPEYESYSDCMDDCVEWASSIMDSELSFYNYTLAHVDSMYPSSQGRADAIALADARFDAGLDRAEQIGLDCLEGC